VPSRPVVCEVSSFQLEDVHAFRPRVAVLLNLEPDHLDRHGTFDAYRAAKLRLFENQVAGDTAVVPRGFDELPGSAHRVEFAVDDPLPAEPRIRGPHNRANAAAAVAAVRPFDPDEAQLARALRSFPGVPHRQEIVGEHGGVTWVNDSKATNVAAARPALVAYAAETVRLILGGSLKGEDFRPLAEAIGPNVRSVFLIGEAADAIAGALDAAGVAYERAGDLERAVRMARQLSEPGDVVLLSPACASYDRYANFEERGEHFRRLVEEGA
jgi:UDP-N-acetylmuramoylalanine--D-glutamate ligase